MQANTTGGNNTAIGQSALTNANASNNTAVGYQALKANTTGDTNVAIGKDSMLANTTGTNNTAVGPRSLQNHTTASNNVAVGDQALFNTNNNSNVGVGTWAGLQNTSGADNTYLGYRAGYYLVSTTTGSNNTLLGSYSYTTTSDSLGATVIGHAVAGAQGYATIGYGSSDIRAAHGSTTWSTVSDERYKKDIVDSTAGLSFVNALQPRTFKYKNLGELPETFSAYKADSTEVFKSSQTQHGFIAQEVKAAIDADDSIKDGFKLWDDRDDGSQEIAESALIPVLVKALQELSAKNDALEARIATLEGA
jgi:hypothetical protein